PQLSEEALIQAMVENPKLIERPIVVSHGQARIGRPPEQVLEIVAEEAKGKIKLIAHVGCVSTAESQQLAASAKRYGFDAVSAVT
ncbi:dihydrodipicolinate synthase family protein, partial [Haemophilus seminalis]|uniref:dihydrodipicolinate synthase family protein n=1 Tax=Haemophilus seminalis TaxID=2582921 RepID=UPI002553C5AC